MSNKFKVDEQEKWSHKNTERVYTALVESGVTLKVKGVMGWYSL